MNQLKNKILFIEDEIICQEVTSSYLKANGFEVCVYSDGLDALNDLQNKVIECDVILTDLLLPSISGIQIIEKLRSIGIKLPVIILTSSNEVELCHEAICAGAVDFLVKPVHFPQLLITIQRAIHAHKISAQVSKSETILQSDLESINKKWIVGKSECFINVLNLAKRVANSTASILIRGESGAGKEVIAQVIHDFSNRRKFPFIGINCSAIPENLLESELFGHAKGAFTGAIDKKVGLFEEAEGGTLFLDEIGDMSVALQTKLLRVLQERKIKRIGENQYRKINVRVISATHKDLNLEVAEKKFREDLFYRLNVIPILIPPLRDRREDLIPLAESFLKKFASANESQVRSLSKEAIQYIVENQWRGNVRELENTIERAVVLCTESEISLENFMPHIAGLKSEISNKNSEFEQDSFMIECSNQLATLDEVTQKYIEYAVKKNGGARDRTAREIGIDRKTLYKRLRQDVFLTLIEKK